ncbi:MATH domain and coiled-coil domain-containing protein At2g05420-like isoform X1, partial [Fagus crenata]
HYRPTHYLLKIQSYSLLIDTGVEKYEGGVFEASGHKWRLSLYPKGNLKMNVIDHISLYLEILDIEKYPLGWEVNASFNLFVFDQKRDKFLTNQDVDGTIRRFHDVKTEWGFNKFLSLISFNLQCNGYLVNDCCVFGAEVFVHERSGKREFLSMIKEPPNGVMTWKLENFSALNKVAYYSQVFPVGDLKWKLLLYPKGIFDGVPKVISLFLCSCDCLDHCFQPEYKYFAEFKLRIKDQLNNKHVENSGKHWFSNSSNEWGFSQFLFLKDLQDLSKGFLKNDTLIVQAEILLMSTIN